MQQLSVLNRGVSGAVVAGLMLFTAACGSSGSISSSSVSSISSSSGTTPHSTAAMPTLNSGSNFGDTWVLSLDPALAPDSLSIDNIDLINANLVQTQYPSLKTVGQLASRWTVSKNKRTWTFHINPNAKFSNGDPVTAADAKFSMTRSLLPNIKSTTAMLYMHNIVGATKVNTGKSKNLAGVKVINSKTLSITVDKPIAYFLGTLSYPTADILDKRVVQGKTPAQITSTCSLNVSAGPFKPVCRNSGSGKSSFYPSGHTPYIDYVPNPNYVGTKPNFRIHAPFFTSADVAFKAWQGHQINWVQANSSELGTAKKAPGFVMVPQLSTDYITPNTVQPPFNNVHCRLAVAYAINRVEVTTQLLKGTETPLYDVVPPGLQGYFSSPAGVPHYDPARAKKELGLCPTGIHNVTIPTQGAVTTDIQHEYSVIAQNLQAIGASVTMKPLTFNAWLPYVTTALKSHNTPAVENLWIDDYPDSQDWLANLLHTGAQNNIGGYSNPAYDKLVDAGDAEFNPAKRAKEYAKAMRIVLNDGGWISVGYQTQAVVINPCIKGMTFYSNTLWPQNTDWSKVHITC